MDSFTKLKSFLPETERQKANYEWYKPAIKLALHSAVIFLAANIVISSGLYLYTQSIQSNDSDLKEYKTAEKLNNEIRGELAILSGIKKDFNALSVLNSIVTNIPKEVSIERINIDDDKSLITGWSKEITPIQLYVQTINYPGFSAELAGVKKNNDGSNQFTIELKKIKVAKKPAPKKVGEK